MSSDGTAIATCVDGAWHGSGISDLSCQLRRQTDRCGSILAVAHSRHYVLQNVITDSGPWRNYDTTFSHGTKVVYVCDSGYHQVGSSMVECVKGEWSGRKPMCLRHLGCSDRPPSIRNAEFSIYPNEDFTATSDDDVTYVAKEGSRAFYFCHNGFRMSDVNATSLVCRDGEWAGQLPNCG
jgi:Sushi repeat (SCR repeat)